MKKNLLFAALMITSLGFSQNLMLNPTCDEFTVTSDLADANGWTRNDSDNADAYDMTPSSTVIFDAEAMVDGATSPSPYNAIWNNSDLEDWLEVFYLGAAGSLDEQPGSTGSGNGSRGVKLYMDTTPSLPGQSTRRLYQKVEGLTIGADYTFSVESRSEAMNTPSEVYMLNTEITDELGINANGGSDSSVDGYMEITNDFDAWVSNELTFTATNTFVVVYVRSMSSVDGDTEVFYDNFSLEAAATASTDTVLASQFAIYPNPTSGVVNISSDLSLDLVQVFNTLGGEVYASPNTTSIDVSSFAKGVYFLKVSSEDKFATKKLIVK